jgi:hypothetical protein
MIEGQKKRFEEEQYMDVVQKYLEDPQANEAAYLKMLDNESIAQYKDYFRSENDEFDNVVLGLNKKKFALAFENWQIPKQDRSTFQTFPLPEWNKDLGFWANALTLLREAQQVGTKMHQLETSHTSGTLSTSALEEKK